MYDIFIGSLDYVFVLYFIYCMCSVTKMDGRDSMFLKEFMKMSHDIIRFLVRLDKSPENFCHSPDVIVVGGGIIVVVVVIVCRQKL